VSHTRKTIEVVDLECAMNDCGHDARPCPSTGTVEACAECTAANWEFHEGPVVEWAECWLNHVDGEDDDYCECGCRDHTKGSPA
jgi:hypothetical protein